jgi:hypothetical protein
MWNLFAHLLLAFFIGLAILYGIEFLRDTKGFKMWPTVGQAILRLFIGAAVSIVIALCVEYSWLIWVSLGVLALSSNYWMAWLDKKVK